MGLELDRILVMCSCVQGIGQQYDPLQSCQRAFKSAGAPGILHPPPPGVGELCPSKNWAKTTASACAWIPTEHTTKLKTNHH